MKRENLLTVNIITYNHKKYIGRCIDSILSQKTTFDFIVRIFDDCSTDGTVEICNEYAKKYPDKVFFTPLKEHIGITKNCLRSYEDITTPYYLYIEGDDYRVNKYGFQMQIEALEKYPEYDLCAASTVLDGDRYEDSYCDISKGVVYSKDYIIAHPETYFFSNLSTRIVRTKCINIDKQNPVTYLNDIRQLYTLINQGKLIYYLPFVLSVYCVTGTGISTGQNVFNRTKELLDIIMDINSQTNKEFELVLLKYFCTTVEFYNRIELEKFQNNNISNKLLLPQKGKLKIIKKLKHYFLPQAIIDLFNLPRDISRQIRAALRKDKNLLWKKFLS